MSPGGRETKHSYVNARNKVGVGQQETDAGCEILQPTTLL